MNSLVNKLDIYYQQVKDSKNGEQFVYSLFNYVEFIVKNDSILDYVVGLVTTERNRDLLKLNELRNNIQNDANTLIVKFRSIDVDESVKRAIDDYDSFVSGKTQISGDYTDNVIESIRVILARMVSFEKTKTTALEYAVFDEHQNIDTWKWSKYLANFFSEKGKIDRISPAKAWYSWDRYLYLFYQVFSDYEGLIEQELQKKNLFILSGISSAKREIQDIIEGNTTKKYYFFAKHELEHHLTQFHINMDFSSLITAKSNNARASFKNNILSIGDFNIEFKNDGKRSLLLAFLFKDKNKTKRWSWDVWLKEVDGHDYEPEKGKMKHYAACDGIKKQIATKTGITDFLIFNKLDVCINPSYL